MTAREDVLAIIEAAEFDTDRKERAYLWAQKAEEPICGLCGDFGCNRKCFIQRIIEVAKWGQLEAQGFINVDDLQQQLEEKLND